VARQITMHFRHQRICVSIYRAIAAALSLMSYGSAFIRDKLANRHRFG
jgi:hypothetical protein